MRLSIEKLANVMLAIAAAVAAVVLVRQSLGDGAPAGARPAITVTELSDADWTEVRLVAGGVAAESRIVLIVEFVDVECPFCAQYALTLERLKDSIPEVRIVFAHFPLPQHRFAVPGARAIECARPERREAETLQSLLDGQDSLGLKRWIDYADDAGVRDTVAFAACMGLEGRPRLVEEGRAVGERIGVRGTPTLVIDGSVVSGPPTFPQLVTLVRGALEGRRLKSVAAEINATLN